MTTPTPERQEPEESRPERRSEPAELPVEGPKPRGGAAKEIRTGRLIRDYLRRVGEDSIIGIHQALKSEIGKRNLLRPKSRWLGAPTYESFAKYFGHLRRLGLVELVREEPLEAPWGDQPLSLRAGPRPTEPGQIRGGEVVQSTRRIYRLSALGQSPEADVLWDDPLLRRLMTAWLRGGR